MTKPKRCPGFAPGGIEPHELPADLANFNSNAGSRDGLSTRCRPCGKAYGNAWAAAKRKGEPFSARRPKADAIVAQASEAIRASGSIEEAEGHLIDAAVALSDEAAERIRTQPATGIAAATPRDQYVQEQGGQPGWAITTVAGQQYPVPTDRATVGTPEGQAALEAIGTAKRAQARDQKRAERARKAQEAAAAQA